MIESVSEGAGSTGDLKKARRRKADMRPDAIRVDRLPPHAAEAESGIIGCILLDPLDCLPHCIIHLKAGAQVFYDLRNGVIYGAMLEMHERMMPIDVLTLQRWLRDRQLLDQVGGIPYLNQTISDVPSAANLATYTETVLEKYILRKMISACTNAVAKVYEFEGEVDVLLDEFERDALAIRERKVSNRANIKELVQRSLNTIESRWHRQGAIGGLSTGFPDLDKYTDGLCAGELIVPSAYPSVGKTSLLMNIIEHIVLVQKLSAAVFTFEMTAEQLVTRLLCSNARVNWKRIGEGWTAEEDFPKLAAAAGRTSNAALYIVEDVETVDEVRAESRRLKQEHNIAVAGADYIQRIRARVERGANREREIAAVSSGLKDTALELGIPIIAPSQLNDDGKLRESRAIGHDADGIWELSPLPDKATPSFQLVDLWLRKNRNGPRDVCVHLNFFKEYTRFESVAKVTEEDLPPNKNPYNDD